MTETAPRPFRSVLYVPASNARAMAKAAGLPVDALILDLEDAVAPEAKEGAREALRGAAPGPGFRLVRVNGAGTPWYEGDLALVRELRPDAVLLPKVAGPGDVAAAAGALPEGVAVWAMIETPAGVLAAEAIAAAPRVGGLVMGTNDLAAELRAAGRAAMGHALQRTVLAARAAGVVAVDGVCNALRDEDALRAECEEGRRLGFDGKTLIHPAQVAAANAAFGPSAAEVALARRRIDAFAAAERAGQGVAVLDGAIVENLHVAEARRVLALAGALGGDPAMAEPPAEG